MSNKAAQDRWSSIAEDVTLLLDTGTEASTIHERFGITRQYLIEKMRTYAPDVAARLTGKLDDIRAVEQKNGIDPTEILREAATHGDQRIRGYGALITRELVTLAEAMSASIDYTEDIAAAKKQIANAEKQLANAMKSITLPKTRTR